METTPVRNVPQLTTDDVREDFALGRYDDSHTGIPFNESREDFDHWLSEHDAESARKVLAEVVTPRAQAHWDWAERHRQQINFAGCSCELCELMQSIHARADISTDKAGEGE